MPFYNKILSYRSNYKHTVFAVVSVLILFANLIGSDIVEKVYFDITEESEMVIHYTLNTENTNSAYKIQVLISSDGGRTWFSPKTIRGDIGKQKDSGSKQIVWNIFSDLEELEGDVEVKVKAQKKQKLNYISDEKKSWVHILYPTASASAYYSLYYPHTTFLNSTFAENLTKGYLNREGGIGLALRFEVLPIIINFGGHIEAFSSGSSLNHQYDLSHGAWQGSISTALFANYLKVLTPHIGLGYQSSRLSLNRLTVNGIVYDDDLCDYVKTTSCIESKSTTSAFYLNLGIILELRYFQLGIQNNTSLSSDRNWNQLEFYINVNILLFIDK